MALEFSGSRPTDKDLRRLADHQIRTYGEQPENSSAIRRPAGPEQTGGTPVPPMTVLGESFAALLPALDDNPCRLAGVVRSRQALQRPTASCITPPRRR